MSGVASANTSRAPTISLKSISSTVFNPLARLIERYPGADHPGDAVAVGDADPSMPSSSARPIMSAGCDAPRKKL